MTTIPIIALDVGTADAALALVGELGESCRFYKVGSQLHTAAGPQVVRDIVHAGAEVFLDLKYHDIPNTVAGAVRSAAALGARLVTVHAVGGSAMLRAAVDAAGDPTGCGVLAVTLLTSLEGRDVAALWGRDPALDVGDEVMRLAEVAASAGVYGIVCSGREARRVKDRFGESLAVLIPGVRLPGTAAQDQARVVTPAHAAAAGADYIVVGRTVTASRDRREAMSQVLEQLKGAAARGGSLA